MNYNFQAKAAAGTSSSAIKQCIAVKRLFSQVDSNHSCTTPVKSTLSMMGISSSPKYSMKSTIQKERYSKKARRPHFYQYKTFNTITLLYCSLLRVLAMVNMLVQLMLPISIVETSAWKSFMAKFDSSFNVPTRNTIKVGIIPVMIKSVEAKVREKLATIEWVNVSADGWSDATMRCFNGYIAQGIDNDWNMHTLPIAFRFVSGRNK